MFRNILLSQKVIAQLGNQLFKQHLIPSTIRIHSNNHSLSSVNSISKRCLSSRKKSLYEILGVAKTATTKEIKLAYFREAKKYHPDLNPNNPSAKKMFQEVSAAYEILSDDNRRRMYDLTGATQNSGFGSQSSSSGSNQYQSAQQQAEEIFNEVQEDMDVVKEAMKVYTTELKDEIAYAVQCAMRGDYAEFFDIAKAHKGIILGVVIPTVVFLRYPPLVFVVMRALFTFGEVALTGLIATGNFRPAMRLIWRSIVHMSKEQMKRDKKKYH